MEGRRGPTDLSTLRSWTFITNHAQVLLAIARSPDATVAEIAETAEITERSAYRVLADLQQAGYVRRSRKGRHNRYEINRDLPLRDPAVESGLVGDLLKLVAEEDVEGLGNTNAVATLSATYSGTVVCRNNGGNLSDSQHQGTFTSVSSTGQLSPKNGRLTVPSLSSTPPTEAEFIAQQTCPNPNWTPELSGGISLSSFTYTLHFVGFTGDYITITGP